MNSLINLYPIAIRTNKFKFIEFLGQEEQLRILNQKRKKYPLWAKAVQGKKPQNELYAISDHPTETPGNKLSNASLEKKFLGQIKNFRKEREIKLKALINPSQPDPIIEPNLKKQLQALGYLQ